MLHGPIDVVPILMIFGGLVLLAAGIVIGCLFAAIYETRLERIDCSLGRAHRAEPRVDLLTADHSVIWIAGARYVSFDGGLTYVFQPDEGALG